MTAMRSPLPPSRLRRVAKWVGMLVCVCILAAFVFSMRRSVTWRNATVQNEADLSLGFFSWAWRPAGYDAASDRYRARPGWSIAGYGGEPVINEWWPRFAGYGSWEGVILPLWIPFILAAVPTGVLWYRDRRSIREALERWKRRLCPKTKKRVTLGLVGAFALTQVLGVILGDSIVPTLYTFFFDFDSPGFRFCSEAWDIVMALLLLSAPVWGFLWALLLVRTRNRLFDMLMAGHCPACGYDLRASKKVCPECGTAIAPEPR